MTPKYTAEVLSSVPKCKKAVICLAENRPAVDKRQSAVTYDAAGCEFNVKESMMQIK